MQDLFGNEVVRSLGLYQPWASMMLTHNKLETRWVLRGKKPPFPLGKYLIYSCKKIQNKEEFLRIAGWAAPVEDIFGDLRYTLTGMALFIADLVKVRDMEYGDQEKAFVELNDKVYGSRQVVLEFVNRQRIASFPFKGKQGVGILTPEQKAQIKLL